MQQSCQCKVGLAICSRHGASGEETVSEGEGARLGYMVCVPQAGAGMSVSSRIYHRGRGRFGFAESNPIKVRKKLEEVAECWCASKGLKSLGCDDVAIVDR